MRKTARITIWIVIIMLIVTAVAITAIVTSADSIRYELELYRQEHAQSLAQREGGNTGPSLMQAEPGADPAVSPTPAEETSRRLTIRCYGAEVRDEFTMHLSSDSVLTLVAEADPLPENAVFSWTSSDERLLRLTTGEDSAICTVEQLKASQSPVTLTLRCADMSVSLLVRLA